MSKISELPIISQSELNSEFSVNKDGIRSDPNVISAQIKCHTKLELPEISDYNSNSDKFYKFLYRIPGASFLGGLPILFSTENNFLIRAEHIDYSHRGYRDYYYEQCDTSLHSDFEYLKGNTLCLAGQWSNEYYHFLVETLGRIQIANELSDLKIYSNIVLGEKSHPYVKEILNFFNLDECKIIFAEKEKIYKCENLYFTTDNTISGQVTRSFCQYIRDKINIEKGSAGSEKIFVSRKNSRKILEAETLVYPILEKNGFRIVYPENFTFRKQVEIFKTARIILGLHGGGMANTIFANADVHEIFSKHYYNACYCNMNLTINNRYSYQVWGAVSDYVIPNRYGLSNILEEYEI